MKKIMTLLFLCFVGCARGEVRVIIGGATYATVLGNGSPQMVELMLPSGGTVLDALALAGGCSESAYLARVKITRGEGTSKKTDEVDVTTILKNPESAFALMDGDRVFVPTIMDPYPAPHYFNHLLFERAYFKAINRPLANTWAMRVARLNNRGAEAAVK